MRFDDEMNSSLDETDYLDCVKFCADLIWHGGWTCYLFHHQQLYKCENPFLSEYQVKQEDAHPRPDTAMVINSMVITPTLSNN